MVRMSKNAFYTGEKGQSEWRVNWQETWRGIAASRYSKADKSCPEMSSGDGENGSAGLVQKRQVRAGAGLGFGVRDNAMPGRQVDGLVIGMGNAALHKSLGITRHGLPAILLGFGLGAKKIAVGSLCKPIGVMADNKCPCFGELLECPSPRRLFATYDSAPTGPFSGIASSAMSYRRQNRIPMFMNSVSTLKREDKRAATAFTPNTSVA